MRLIDADALIEFCAERWIPLNIDAVNMQPTIEERQKGHWIKKMRVIRGEKCKGYDPEWYCNRCGKKYGPCVAQMINFCYICGSDMRGKVNG